MCATGITNQTSIILVSDSATLYVTNVNLFVFAVVYGCYTCLQGDTIMVYLSVSKAKVLLNRAPDS